MSPSIKRTLNPAWYHGQNATGPFFEGWYFKLVDATEVHKLAIIPGIFLGRDVNDRHAFVQVLDGARKTSHYIEYAADQFQARSEVFDVSVDRNQFQMDKLHLDIHTPALTLKGDVQLEDLKPWPVSLSSPGVMGWYAWIPMMECFHGVLSLDHALSGQLMLNGTTIDLNGGRGYLEKDWGRAFPRGYIWFQSNHFDRTGVSLSASVAIIPWIRRPFPGFIVGFLLDGRLYKFATYTGAKITTLSIDDDQVHWILTKGRFTLELLAERTEGGILQAPTLEGMDRRIVESMNSVVHVKLLERGKVLFDGSGRNCGLEAAGDVDKLVAMGR